MMGHPFRSNELATIRDARRVASRHTPVPGQSSVYPNLAPKGPSKPPLEAWDDGIDDDDRVTLVQLTKSREFARPIPQPPPRQGKRATWQVGMMLRGEELAHLWDRNAASLAGRLFIWSDCTQTWVPIQEPPEVPWPHADNIRQSEELRIWNPGQNQDQVAAASPVATSYGQVGLAHFTNWIFRAQGLLTWLCSGHRQRLAFAALGFAAIALALPRRAALPKPPADAGVQQTPTKSSIGQAADSIPDIIPVEALPLVKAAKLKILPSRGGPMGHTVAQPTASLPFDSNGARRALKGAVWQNAALHEK